MTTAREVLLDAKKALGALGVMEVAAVGAGFIDNAQAGVITGVLGVITAGVVYALKNEPAASPTGRD